MNPRTWFRVSGSVVSAVVLFVSGSACLTSSIWAQSSESVSVELPPVSFLSAPSFHLGGAPTSIATGDLNGDGKLDLVTTDWSSGKVTVSLGLGNGKFAPGVDYTAGPHPGSVIVADIDGDGHPDVIVANQSEGTVRVLLGSGNGKLQQAQAYSIGFNPAFIATGDFNGKGRMDLVVSGSSSRLLAVLPNDGRGNLGKPIVRSLSKTSTSFAVADLNEDGHADLALANDDGTISILLGAGDGSFRSTPDVKVGQGPLSSILAADFNRDGKVDLAVTLAGEKQLSVLVGKGNGGFDSSVSYRVGSNPVSIALGDVDEDGIPDLVVTNQGSNSFSVLRGNGDGTFKNSLDYVAGKGPLAAVTGDFYGAGHLDLAIIDYASQTISLPLGNGDGTFRAARAYSVELQPKAVAFGNLTGSKNSDLVVTNFCGSDAACSKGGTVSVMAAGEDGYRLASTYSLGAGPVAVALLDVDGDKNLDIVALNRNDKTISILLGLGGGSFQQQFTLPLAEAPIAFATGDFNHDGKTDLAVLGDCGSAKCSQPGTVEILYGTGDGSFRSGIAYPVDYSPTSITVGDLNKDKNLDIVVSNSCGKSPSCTAPGTATVFLGDASGKFTAGKDVALGNSPSSIALGDLSGRGILDLLVTRSSDNTVAVLRGVGDGTFQTPAVYNVGTTPGSVAIADFNGDGKLDVAVSNLGDSTVSVLYGKGDGTLLAGNTLPVGPGPESLTAIQSGNGHHASLVTANGNSASSTPGTDITVLANIQPEETAASTTMLTSLPTSSTVNQSVTLTAVVTGSGATPAGNVEFESNGTDITGCSSKALDNTGTAECVTADLAGGTDSLTAIYGGQTNVYTGSTGTASEGVTPLTATMTLTPSVTTTPVNSSVTFTAAVTATTVTPVAPSGTVTFKINGVTSSDCPPQTVNGSGQATCTTKSLTVGNGTVTATYADDTSFTFTGTATSTVTVTSLTATMTLTPSVTTTPVNGSIVFTAKVSTATTPPPAPNGTVTFKINGKTNNTDCPPQTVNGSGQATCTTKSLTVGNGTVTATYSGDTNFTFSGTATSTVTVTPLPATLTMASVPSSSTVDQSVTFTTGFTATTITPTVPTGTVSFTINGAASSDCPPVPLNASGQATCTTSSLIYPADKVIATYAGDSNFSVTAATGTYTVAQTVAKATAQTTVTSSSPTSAVNQSVTFTATVVAPEGTSAPIQPTGSVTFTQGSTTLCTSVALSSADPATASCPYTFTKAIAFPGAAITATFSGDSNFLAGTPGSTTQIVGSAASKTTLVSASNPSTVNQQVTFTANVTAASSGSAIPSSGTVVFTNAATNPSTTYCAPQALTAGTPVVCNYTFTTPGPFNVVASFISTDPAFGNSISDPITQQVGASGTSVTLTSSPINSDVNQQVSLTAVVNFLHSGTNVPTGTINFVDGTTKKQFCTVSAVFNSSDNSVSGSCPPYAFDTAGAHPITANYVSNSASTFQGSSSPVLIQLVSASPTTTSVVSSVNPAVVNQPLTFAAEIQPTFLGPPASPTGYVTFSAGAVTLCAASTVGIVQAGGAATCQASFSSKGSYTITAKYSGDNNFETSSSANLTVTVDQAATTVNVTSSPSTSVVDQPVVFTAAVTQPFSVNAQTIPTGTVVFFDSTTLTTLCSAVLSSTSSTPMASCTASSLNAQKHVITAAYGGDINFKQSSSSINQIVQPGPSVVALAVTAPTPPIPISVATQSITVTAEVSASDPGGVEPTGSVTFTSTDGAAHCSKVPLVTTKGTPTASCTIAFPANDSGSVTITATYSGDANFTSSTVPLIQSVQNFALQFVLSSGSQTGPIAITQGSSNTSDQFHSVAVNATSAPLAGFADTLVLNCVVKNSAGNTITDPLTGPICSPNPGSLTNDGATTAKLPYTFSTAATTPVGRYTVYLTGTDSTTTQLTQAAPPVTIDVVGQAGSLSLAPGAIGTEFVTFNTASAPTSPAPTLQSFACGTVVTVSGGDGTNLAGQVTCSSPSASVPITGQATTVSITVATEAPTTVSASRRPSAISTAAFWGIPLLALLAWFGRRGSPRRSFFRFLGMIVLLVGIGNAIGCGSGGFTRPPAQTGGATTGSYLVQVIATDSNGANYYAVVPLVVQPLQSSSTQ